VSKKAFYRQKTRFLAERTPLDAQSLHKVAQKVRAMEAWPLLNWGRWKPAQPFVAAVGRPPQIKQERERMEAGSAVNPRRLDKDLGNNFPPPRQESPGATVLSANWMILIQSPADLSACLFNRLPKSVTILPRAGRLVWRRPWLPTAFSPPREGPFFSLCH
jgi:hypothetical protein